MSLYELIGDALIILIFVLMAVDLPDIEDDD
mgnify:FL=1